MKIMNYKVYYIFATAMLMLSIIFSVFFTMYYDIQFFIIWLGFLGFGVSLLGLFMYYDLTRDRVHREFVVKSMQAVRVESDPLTSIYTKRKFDELLELEKERMKVFQTTSSIIGIDVDNFEKININYGLQIGDSVLKQFVAKTKDLVPDNVIFARHDGNSFLLMYPDVGVEEAIDKAEIIRRKLSDEMFEPIGNITASFAVVELEDKIELEALYDMVSEKIKMAKNRGKNMVI